MSDYISREAVRLIESDSEVYAEAWNASYEAGFCDGINAVLELPSADVVEVKHGEWEQKEVFEAKGHVDELQSAFCPVCQRYHTTPYSYYFTRYNYCPNCGARMDGGDHDATD